MLMQTMPTMLPMTPMMLPKPQPLLLLTCSWTTQMLSESNFLEAESLGGLTTLRFFLGVL
jgi:hypothetical protein